MTFEDRKAIALADMSPDEVVWHLDEEIYKIKSMEASKINNDGVNSQLTYLFQHGLTEEDINNKWHNIP